MNLHELICFFAEERSNLTTHRNFQNSPCVAFPKIIAQQKILKLLFRLGSSIHDNIQVWCKFDIISCPLYVCHRHEPTHMQSCLRLLSTVSILIELFRLSKKRRQIGRKHSFAQEKANNRITSLFLMWVFKLHILSHTSSELKRKQKHRK